MSALSIGLTWTLAGVLLACAREPVRHDAERARAGSRAERADAGSPDSSCAAPVAADERDGARADPCCAVAAFDACGLALAQLDGDAPDTAQSDRTTVVRTAPYGPVSAARVLAAPLPDAVAPEAQDALAVRTAESALALPCKDMELACDAGAWPTVQVATDHGTLVQRDATARSSVNAFDELSLSAHGAASTARGDGTNAAAISESDSTVLDRAPSRAPNLDAHGTARATSSRTHWWRPAPSAEAPLVALSTLRRDGLQWLGRNARAIVQFDHVVDSWDPWISRFHPASWQCISAWGDEQFLWERDAWEHPCAELYVRRDGPAAAVLAGAVLTKRYELEIVVREHVLGAARIEVVSATPLSENVGEGAVLHASRAVALLEHGDANLAKSEFERALAGLLPPHARAELERWVARCDDADEARAARSAASMSH